MLFAVKWFFLNVSVIGLLAPAIFSAPISFRRLDEAMQMHRYYAAAMERAILISAEKCADAVDHLVEYGLGMLGSVAVVGQFCGAFDLAFSQYFAEIGCQLRPVAH